MHILILKNNPTKTEILPIHLENRGLSIEVSLISWFLIMTFNFGYAYVTNGRLNRYV